MQTGLETLPRKLRIRLGAAQDVPVEIIWQQDERVVTPKTEVFFGDRCYQPHRTERGRKGEIKIIPAESFTAVIDEELKLLWRGGKVDIQAPHLDRGRTKEGGIPAYRPWPGSVFESASNDPFDDTLVKVRMRPTVWQQIFPGLPGKEIMPGTVFFTTWAVIRALGYGQIGHLGTSRFLT
jgi:hypothetical protein